MKNRRTMMKTIYTLLLAALCSYSVLPAQNLSTWALTSDGTPTFEANDIIAWEITRGNGVSSPTYSADGATTFGWEQGTVSGEMDYLELCLRPSSGNSMSVSGLNFSEMRSADGIRDYLVAWSTDGFNTFNTLANNTVPDDELTRTENISGLNIRICDGEELCLRWYAYNAESFNGEWSLSNVEVLGTTSANCTPPVLQASGLSVTNSTISTLTLEWTNGDGDGTLIVGRAGQSFSEAPCSGVLPNADSEFGMGDDIGGEVFVVYAGSAEQVTVTGLDAGQTYFFKAFEYNTVDYCYQSKTVPQATATTLCHQAGVSPDLSYSALNGKAFLEWEPPLCYDQILIVGSESSIASVPTSPDGTHYVADAEFGDGIDNGSDFLATEYPVYKGTSNKVTITGLDNGTTYYFKIYVRWGVNWSPGNEISLTPKEGCVGINNDVVFINEIHATNAGDDIDEGVEIAGPAGVDLSNYTLTFYLSDGFINTGIGINGDVALYDMIDDEDDDFGAMWFPVPDLPYFGGIVLWNEMTGEVVEFLSYRIGDFPAYEGIADNMASTGIIGVQEGLNSPVNFSIQRTGTGTCPSDLSWTGPILSSRGEINDGQQAALPITLAYFSGQLKGERVLLNWQTATELNNDYMAVEHSMDGRNFKEIGRVEGKGNSQLANDYQLWHNYPQEGVNYYRLRQVDFDGTTAYHGTVAIRYQGETAKMLAFPTVARQQITVQLQGVEAPTGELFILDAYGREYARIAVQGEIQRELPLSTLPQGQYYLRWIQDNGTQLTNRFIKQ